MSRPNRWAGRYPAASICQGRGCCNNAVKGSARRKVQHYPPEFGSLSTESRCFAQVPALHVEHYGRTLVGQQVRLNQANALAAARRGHNALMTEGRGNEEGALRPRGHELAQDEIRAAWQRSRYASFCSASPRYLPRQHSLTMHRKGCCEPCATELPDDVKDAGIIGGLANRTAEIRSVELPVDAGCRLDLVQKC